MESEIINNEQRESIKLERNSRGYNWEIKVFAITCRDPDDPGKVHNRIGETDIMRLEQLNDEMITRFGSVTEISKIRE